MTPQETMEARKQAEEILRNIKGEKKFVFKDLSLSGFNKTKTEKKEHGTGTKKG
jgi:hypothetical protein